MRPAKERPFITPGPWVVRKNKPDSLPGMPWHIKAPEIHLGQEGLPGAETVAVVASKMDATLIRAAPLMQAALFKVLRFGESKAGDECEESRHRKMVDMFESVRHAYNASVAEF